MLFRSNVAKNGTLLLLVVAQAGVDKKVKPLPLDIVLVLAINIQKL